MDVQKWSKETAYLSSIPGSFLSHSLVVQGLNGGFIQTFQLFRLNGYLHITRILLPQNLQPTESSRLLDVC